MQVVPDAALSSQFSMVWTSCFNSLLDLSHNTAACIFCVCFETCAKVWHTFLHLQRILAENGPFNINEDLTLKDNPHGWDVSHNMIYVDQPIGTGYSYSNDPADEVHGEKGMLPCSL